MTAKVRKAVFPVAGMGTRFLPATKAMPKELLPVIDRPLIQIAVEEALAAGITELIFVTGRTKRAIEDHFDAMPELENELESRGKEDLAEIVRSIVPDYVTCIFIRQPRALGLGHAVLCAEPVVGNEPFAVLLADDVIRADRSTISDLIDSYNERKATQLSAMEVPDEDVNKYGMIVPGEGENDVAGLHEKPTLADSPSNLASIGRYLLEPVIFDILRSLPPGAGGEIQLADAIHQRALAGEVRSVTLKGTRYDCGSKFGFLTAIVDYALAHNEFGDDFAELIKDRVTQIEAAKSEA